MADHSLGTFVLGWRFTGSGLAKKMKQWWDR
jgi:hypothetical protein